MIDVISISCGAMLSGLFILPGMAFAQAGPSLMVSFVIAGMLAISGMLSQAELVSAMPKAGGAYFFVSRSMGPTVGAIYGLITWLALCLKSAVELLACAALSALLLPVPVHMTAIILGLIFFGINMVGIKEAGKVQVVFIAVIFCALLIYMILGVSSIEVNNFEPFVTHGAKGVLAAAGFIFVAFGGLLKVASIAEEIKSPGRNIPKAMIFSLIIILLTYFCVIFITIGVLTPGQLSGSTTPISMGAAVFMGSPGGHLFTLVAVFAILSAANAGIMAASRYPLALSRDGLCSPVFSRINTRFNTPHFSILVTGVMICAAIFLSLETIVKAASSVLILTYMFSCVSTIIMRESHLQNYQPQFLSPLYPWVQILGFAGFAGILFYMGAVALLIGLLLVMASLFLYLYYRGTRTNRDFALLYLIERITDRKLTAHLLETEFKEIIQERDNILKDRFDHLIEKCTVIDINGSMTRDEFFRIVAREMAPGLGHSDSEILESLIERETESSTALTPCLAIPHIIIEGEGVFDVMLCRCKEGIIFDHASASHIHAVFVLIGSKDMRQMHLMSLAAIAQIVQHEGFEDRWMKARNEEALRDIILLSKRKRHEHS
ncbi:MAG: amino acid permease [Thermodesulfobacteriota bacterium]|nr:amino acid permease [Thermodesulfobacteriota bacterium]